MPYAVTVPPIVEPVTLKEAKAWLKIEPDFLDEDALIQSLIATARIWAEGQTGRALMIQTVQEVYDCPALVYELMASPVAAVSAFQYLDANGAYQTWANTNYTVDTISPRGRVVVKSQYATTPLFPAYPNMYPNRIKITYTAGVASPDLVDANIKTAMRLMIGLMYENREDMPLGRDGSPTARSAWNLLALSRVSWL